VIVGITATHSVNYINGYFVEVTNTFAYTGTVGSLSWEVSLPSGWSFVSNAGTVGSVAPFVGETGEIGWAYTSVPPSPVTFTYVVNAPYGNTNAQMVPAQVFFTQGGPVESILATPSPLGVDLSNIYHSADEGHAGTIDLSNLTRVIELYNTRSGSIRTGCYLTDESSEDGFNPDTSRSTSAAFALPYYHSADENQVGNLDLAELTRVVELYNYRVGGARTGQYSPAPATEDGFQPGP
jgi:hypothetical protein